MSKVVGILGGMGPMSTVDLMRMVTERTPVRSEAEHLRILVEHHQTAKKYSREIRFFYCHVAQMCDIIFAHLYEET